jgi:hypothetical protein
VVLKFSLRNLLVYLLSIVAHMFPAAVTNPPSRGLTSPKPGCVTNTVTWLLFFFLTHSQVITTAVATKIMTPATMITMTQTI